MSRICSYFHLFNEWWLFIGQSWKVSVSKSATFQRIVLLRYDLGVLHHQSYDLLLLQTAVGIRSDHSSLAKFSTTEEVSPYWKVFTALVFVHTLLFCHLTISIRMRIRCPCPMTPFNGILYWCCPVWEIEWQRRPLIDDRCAAVVCTAC